MSEGVVLAGRLRRLAATAIDFVLVPSLTLLLVMLTDVVEDAEDYADSWWVTHVFLLAVVSYLILNGYTLWRRGQTLGKLLLGIAIVPAATSDLADFVPAPLWKLICVRALFFPLLYLPITLLSPVLPAWLALPALVDQAMIFGKRRRCLHDLVAGTAVVRRVAR